MSIQTYSTIQLDSTFELERFDEFNGIEINFDNIPFTWSNDNEPTLDGSNKAAQSQRMSNSSKWLYNLCQKHVNQQNGAFSPIELSIEILSTYLQSLNQKQPMEYFQDKVFQLLGDECFEILSEFLSNFEYFNSITSSALHDCNNTSLSEIEPEIESYIQLSDAPPLDGNVNPDYLAQLGFSSEYLMTERSLGLQKGKAFASTQEHLQHWNDDLLPEGTLVYHEKRGLPAGAEKVVGPGFEEVYIPAATNKPINPPSGLISITHLEPWAQLAFGGMKTLNTIQSIVFAAAYNTSQNMLICAPTGAGKTNIAMLAFLQHVKDHVMYNEKIDKASVKAIYVAPMKALAQEVVAKFSERLKPLNMTVKEFTGDMQLTKQEISDSQLIVTTPEKYDVISRKGGDGSLSTMVSLIIIDEIHLLADDRGAVIETIVARTHRYIESSQKRIRIVGLSATLPNYEDVAKFLKVNLKSGLFYFGPEYRPVPLKQTFIGVTEKIMSKRKDFMNRKAYEKMVVALQNDKQVMIFVHSRKETSKTAQAMVDICCAQGTVSLLDNAYHEKYGLWKKEVDRSHSSELQMFFYKGVGCHHAGMARADRTLTEELFQYGLIRVLCCTSTLAWGVNLPAHTVIIKGTEIYDPERGGFVDLSILDVLQIFGRAGRPQYDNTGHAILITPHKTLDSYLGLLGNQAPIESSLIKSLADHLNAEIVNGTVNSIKDAVAWLSYTFLFVRMCKNPMSYGLNYEDTFADPQLNSKRMELIVQAAQILDRSMMARYDPKSGNLGVTDLGRVASHYYIQHSTIEAFNSMLNPHLNDVDALHVICSSAEFDQLRMRPEEANEMDALKKHTTIQIKIPLQETAGKVNVLLQSYLSQSKISSFTLQSDTNYVAQNAGRITRALFEICLKRGWSTLAGHYLEMCKSIDRRVRPDQSPLRQFYFDELPRDVLRRLEELNTDVNVLLEMDPKEIGQLVRNTKAGSLVLSLVQKLPYLNIQARIQPITRGIIRIMLEIGCDFLWSDKYHGQAEPFWIWIEDGENEYIYHSEYFILTKRQRGESHHMDFTIPVREPLPPQYYLKAVSDRWLGCTAVQTLSFKHLILPDRMPPHTDLLNVHPVPKSALKNAAFEALYTKFSHFNPIQSQVFYSLYHTDMNVLVGAPTGSGKTIVSELAILRLLNTKPDAKIIYVAPLKALARERVEDWNEKLGKGLGLSVLELTGDNTPDGGVLNFANLLIVTPEKWDSVSRGWQRREYVQKVELIIIDEIHLLGVERGAVLEAIVSRMRFIAAQVQHPIRFVGLSTALANPRDLADWMGIGQIGVYNFRPAVRPIPMTIHIQGFPGKHYCPRMATMNKPTYAAICEHSPTKPALVFVSSRRQTRLTALDMIAYCAADDNPKKFLHMPEEEISLIAETIRDQALRNTIVFGVAIHHAGLDNQDRKTVEQLYLQGKIQVLIATSTLAWGVNLPCHLVIVKGTEYYDGKTKRYINFEVTDILQMMGRAGRPQFDDTGVACVFVHEPLKNFYRKFLFEPFPVESSLHKQLHEHLNAEVVTGVLSNMQDCLEYISWTYYFRRLAMNPSYYQLEDASPTGVTKHLKELLWRTLQDLEKGGCIEIDCDSETFSPTTLGKIVSYYYLHYRTVGVFVAGLHKIASEFPNFAPDDVAFTTTKMNDRTELIFLEQYAKLISDAYEFSEIPVRHNEDLLNADLAEIAPWHVDPTTFLQENTKAYLLLQAHLYRLPLPIVDYVVDTKLVMDQVPRVLNALIDVAADRGMLSAVLVLMKLGKLVIQGLNTESSELMQLPGVESDDEVSVFNSHKISTIRDLLETPYFKLESILKGDIQSSYKSKINQKQLKQQFSDMSIADENIDAKVTPLRSDRVQSKSFNNKQQLSEFPLSEFLKTIKEIPLYEMSSKVRKTGANEWTILHDSDTGCAQIVGEGSKLTSTTSVHLPNDCDCQLEVNLSRLGVCGITPKRGGKGKTAVYCPRFNKPKEMSWWLVLGSLSTGELLALKRIGSIGYEQTYTLDFVSSADLCTDNMTLYLVSDSVLGIDLSLSFTVITKALDS